MGAVVVTVVVGASEKGSVSENQDLEEEVQLMVFSLMEDCMHYHHHNQHNNSSSKNNRNRNRNLTVQLVVP